MRKILLTLAALAAFGIALPVASTPSEARDVVVIKKHRDHGRHLGWRNHRHDRVVISTGRRHHHRTNGAAVIVR